ncbi:hypothetical protein ACWD25_56075, partial [Streptomyces sp. NPDC002920]
MSFLAAYAIVRGTSRALRRAFSVFLLGPAIPLQATIIPVYCLIAKPRSAPRNGPRRPTMARPA